MALDLADEENISNVAVAGAATFAASFLLSTTGAGAGTGAEAVDSVFFAGAEMISSSSNNVFFLVMLVCGADDGAGFFVTAIF